LFFGAPLEGCSTAADAGNGKILRHGDADDIILKPDYRPAA